jgi:ABC-2 type transport system permease protein
MNIKYAIGDTVVMTSRVMKQILRSVDTIITVLIMPIMMMLAFRYVFGGAMSFGAYGAADYILPGILMFTVMSGIAYVAYRLNIDVQKGIFERFHSMPIAKSSILGGHVLTSVITNMISVIAVILVGLLIGFRPQAGAVQWFLATAIMLLFTAAMTWVSVFFGLIAKSVESASVFSYLLMGLAFVSSAFAPVDTMPAALAAFARYQPMTAIADSVRCLLLGQPTGHSLPVALAWCIVIGAAFWALSVRAYTRKMR